MVGKDVFVTLDVLISMLLSNVQFQREAEIERRLTSRLSKYSPVNGIYTVLNDDENSGSEAFVSGLCLVETSMRDDDDFSLGFEYGLRSCEFTTFPTKFDKNKSYRLNNGLFNDFKPENHLSFFSIREFASYCKEICYPFNANFFAAFYTSQLDLINNLALQNGSISTEEVIKSEIFPSSIAFKNFSAELGEIGEDLKLQTIELVHKELDRDRHYRSHKIGQLIARNSSELEKGKPVTRGEKRAFAAMIMLLLETDVYSNETDIKVAIRAKFPNLNGLSDRSLDTFFADAKKTLE